MAFAVSGNKNAQAAVESDGGGAEGSQPRERIARNRIDIVHCLRGLAALAVCWFHFTQGNQHFLSSQSWLRKSGTYGWLGVEVFFVISGFILPYALHAAGYLLSLRTYRLFLAKRIIRLEPPYLVSIVMVLVLNVLSQMTPGFRGQVHQILPAQVAAHFGYLCGLLHYNWLNVAYWTLGIEVQFYVTIALLYPLISSHHTATRVWTSVCLLMLASLPTANTWAIHYLFLFIIGIATFQARTGLSEPAEWGCLMAAASIGASWVLGIPEAVAGLGAAAMILGVSWNNPLLHVLGNLSYSLYLVHVPIGGRVINLGERWARGTAAEVAVLATAVALSLTAAYVMYRFVEQPAQAFASRIRLGEKRRAAPVMVEAPRLEGANG